MPNNCPLFLVDTYDTLQGSDAARRHRWAGGLHGGRGHEMIGVRLDSGDLAWLSVEARKILDPKAKAFPELPSSPATISMSTSWRHPGSREPE